MPRMRGGVWSDLCSQWHGARMPVDRPHVTPGSLEAASVAGAGSPPPSGDPADDELREQVRAAWASLLDDSGAIADAIALTLLERDKALYERAETWLPAMVRESTRKHVRRGLESMAGRPGAGHRAAELWRDTGRERARHGVPMELVLNAYTLGARALWEALLARQASGLLDVSERVLLAAGRSVWASLDVQNALMIEAYRRESSRVQRRDLRRRNGMLDAIADGRTADPDVASEARELLGLPDGGDVACVVALYDGSLEEPFVAPEDRLERLGIVSVWHVRAGISFGLLAGRPLPSEPALVDLLGEGALGRAALALSPDGLTGFPTAYQLATRAAQTLDPGTRQLVSVADRIPEVLMAGSPEVLPLLLRQTVQPLLAQPGAQARTLMDTLLALLRHDGSPTHAAEDLFCHRNTVIYRLRQIEDTTGRSLSDPRDKLLLTLGAMAAAHAAAEQPPG